MKTKKQAIIMGVFICIALAILVVTVFTLGGKSSTFIKKIPLKVLFKDVGGLQVGDNVWFSGIKVGITKNVELLNDSTVEVTMNIENKILPFIHKDAKVKLSSEGLLGNKLLVIYGGTANSPLVEKNDHLSPAQTTSTDDMLSTLQKNNENILKITDKIAKGEGSLGALINDKSLVQNLTELTNNLRSASTKIAKGQGSLGSLINDNSLANNLNAAISNFKAASIRTEKLMANLEDFTGRLNHEGTSINELISDTTLYYSIKETITKLNSTVKTANDITENIKTLSDQLNNQNSTLGVLLKNEEVGTQIKTMIRNLESGSKKLDEDLEAIQHNFLFRGFFRKKAKNDP